MTTRARKERRPDRLAQVIAALDENRPEDARALLASLHPADIADLLEGIPPEQRHAVWALVPPAQDG